LYLQTLRYKRGFGLPDARKDFPASSALRDMHLGSGQKESVSEEALRWKSSVSATEDTLHEFFSQSGVSPSAVNLIRDRFTGQSRGFAFVEISNDEEADRAVNSLNGQNFGDAIWWSTRLVRRSSAAAVVDAAVAASAAAAADMVAVAVDAAAVAVDAAAAIVEIVAVAATVEIVATAGKAITSFSWWRES